MIGGFDNGNFNGGFDPLMLAMLYGGDDEESYYNIYKDIFGFDDDDHERDKRFD